jgi:hypothetical protein
MASEFYLVSGNSLDIYDNSLIIAEYALLAEAGPRALQNHLHNFVLDCEHVQNSSSSEYDSLAKMLRAQTPR